jgi:hypothetical protein
VPTQELKVQLTGRAAALRVLSRMPVAIPSGGVARIRIGTPPARSVGDAKFELVEPPPGITIVGTEPGLEYVDVIVACDAKKTKPGTQGNLLFNAFGERRSAKDANGAPRVQRSPLGIVPAIPFDIVTPPEPPT